MVLPDSNNSDSSSNYQGAGAWIAPNGSSYPTTEERRNSVGEDSPDLNIDDMAHGYSNQPMDIFTNPKSYGHDSPEHLESARIINHAINEIKRTGEIPTAKMYRAVPKDIKEASFRNGDWITPSRAYARMHGEHRLDGKYRIIEQEVPANQIWWDGNDINEYGFDDGNDYSYQNTKNNRKLNELITRDDKGNIIPPSKRFNQRKKDIRFREGQGTENMTKNAKAVNDKFNEELQRHIEGTLPNGHVYNLGMPSNALLSAGLPNLPVEMASSRLEAKSEQDNHPFDLSEIKDLPEAIQKPMAVFRSATHIGSYVVITEISHNGKNFVVAIEANRKAGRTEVNSVRSVHYRTSNAHMANWIDQGLLEYVDKIKMVEWLSKQQYNSADVRKLFNHAAKVVKDFENPTLEDGKITSVVENLSELLHTPVKTIHDSDEIKDNNEARLKRKRGSKGWYDTNTGEIVIVVPNNGDVEEAKKTTLHEVVAHKGLRELFGKNFDTFLYNVYANANKQVRENINGLAAQNGWDIPLATEEYMAKLAEDTDFENAEKSGWWSKIKDFFIEMLAKAGIKLKKKISDNELRYILWRSYKLLEEPNQYAPITVAEDTAMQNNLGVGRFKEDKLFRDGETKDNDKEDERLSFQDSITNALIDLAKKHRQC